MSPVVVSADERGPSSEDGDELGTVVAVLTHGFSSALRPVVISLLMQSKDAQAELLVVLSAGSDETRTWLMKNVGASRVIVAPPGCGPGAARNAVLEKRPSARTYFFFDDDVILQGGELAALTQILDADGRVGLASGLPTREDGVPLILQFERRPASHVFPEVWNRWWGERAKTARPGSIDADLVSSASIGIRGHAVRQIGGFDPVFWPGCHEDTDFCARLKSAGFRVVVDRATPVRQMVSTTMGRVLGEGYRVHCQATGVVYAAMNYPLPIAVGRLVQASLSSLLARDPRSRRGDANGLLRCAQDWLYILRARRFRRGLRRARPVLLR